MIPTSSPEAGSPIVEFREGKPLNWNNKDIFITAGFQSAPWAGRPCARGVRLWGSADEGLDPPVWLPNGTPMFSIKRNRNTYVGHTGEMASWQMRGVHGKAVGRPMA